ncbi:MAG: OB-fold nucleic acid binding domain-containing protein, partial [Candidatus Zixiibacteriota bacterium]
MPAYSELKRTHTCGELRLSDKGKKVKINGWVNTYRNLGGILFIDLRDRYGITQIVIDPENIDTEMASEAIRTRNEFVVAAIGTVTARPEGTHNPNLDTGEIDIKVDEFYILSESKTPPFEITDNCLANEQLRLEYRYLDLRRTP